MDYISYLKQKVYENVSHLYIGSQLKSLWKKVPGKLFPLLTSSWIFTFIKEKEREKERFSGQSRKRKSSDAQAAVHFPSRRWILFSLKVLHFSRIHFSIRSSHIKIFITWQ